MYAKNYHIRVHYTVLTGREGQNVVHKKHKSIHGIREKNIYVDLPLCIYSPTVWVCFTHSSVYSTRSLR